MSMYIKLLDENVLNVSKIREDKDIIDVKYFDDLIICTEKSTGSMYKVNQCEPNIKCYDDITWIKMKPYEVDASRHIQIEPTEIVTEIEEYDDHMIEECERMNDYYINDDVHAGFESHGDYREGFSL